MASDIRLSTPPHMATGMYATALALAVGMVVVAGLRGKPVGVLGAVLAAAGAGTLVGLSVLRAKLGPNQTAVAFGVAAMVAVLGIAMAATTVTVPTDAETKRAQAAAARVYESSSGEGPAAQVVQERDALLVLLFLCVPFLFLGYIFGA